MDVCVWLIGCGGRQQGIYTLTPSRLLVGESLPPLCMRAPTRPNHGGAIRRDTGGVPRAGHVEHAVGLPLNASPTAFVMREKGLEGKMDCPMIQRGAGGTNGGKAVRGKVHLMLDAHTCT